MKNPNIRFVDDNTDWEEKLLGTTVSLTTGKLDANTAVKDGKYAFFTCGKQQLLTNTFSFAGDAILINGNGDLGYTRRYSGLFDAYQRTYVLQNFKENFEFIELSIKRKLPNKIKEEAIGGAMPYIRADTISNLKIHLPTLKTQQKISSLLSNIDQKINAEEDLIQKLKNAKSAMLLKMFPRENQSVPELRFVGFVDAWEQCKLGEVVEFYNGDRSSRYPNDRDIVSEGIPFINAGDLVSGRVKLDTANKITKEKYNELSGAKIQHGDIIYCLRGTLGKNAFADNFDVGTVASSLVDIRPQKIVGKYLFQVLNSDIEYRQRTINDEGAAQPNLSAKNLSLFNIPMPTEDEQEKIASYFDCLDHLITLHQCKLKKYKEIKSALLDKLLV